MPDISQTTVKLTVVVAIVVAVFGMTGSGVWWGTLTLINIQRDIKEIKSSIGSRWRLTDMQRWCRETERLNGNKWRCADPHKIVVPPSGSGP